MCGDSIKHDTLLVDSSGFSISECSDWMNAKYCKISVRLFAKLHIIHALRGMICAATVTPGNCNDSPQLRYMVEVLPEGNGDVLADTAYGGIKNCNAIRDSGRRAIINPKSNAQIKVRVGQNIAPVPSRPSSIQNPIPRSRGLMPAPRC